ncbi:MAG: hypothetical protein E7528_05680 [Ruminococcaceae bacterium]|nr:hypothetical protein [Oscillospiraceae bacterium]
MIDIESLLASVSDEDMAKIRSVAESLMNNNEPQQEKAKETQKTPDFPIDMNTVSKIMSVMGQMNKEDYRTRLITDLKPMLNTERQKKADEAVKFLQLMQVLPLLKGLF